MPPNVAGFASTVTDERERPAKLAVCGHGGNWGCYLDKVVLAWTERQREKNYREKGKKASDFCALIIHVFCVMRPTQKLL